LKNQGFKKGRSRVRSEQKRRSSIFEVKRALAQLNWQESNRPNFQKSRQSQSNFPQPTPRSSRSYLSLRPPARDSQKRLGEKTGRPPPCVSKPSLPTAGSIGKAKRLTHTTVCVADLLFDAPAGRGCLRLLKRLVFIRDNLFDSGKLFRDVELLKMKKKREQRELVAFITVQRGDDLIVSFAVCKPDDPSDIESLTILRTPKYEIILEEWERGASVSFRRELEGNDREILREVFYSSDDKCVTLRTDDRTYKLDVRKVDPRELSAMCGVFRQMNFDSTIRLTGV
jgi:hypothetical protein